MVSVSRIVEIASYTSVNSLKKLGLYTDTPYRCIVPIFMNHNSIPNEIVVRATDALSQANVFVVEYDTTYGIYRFNYYCYMLDSTASQSVQISRPFTTPASLASTRVSVPRTILFLDKSVYTVTG